MTVNETSSKISYVGNGSTRDWSFGFALESPAHIRVFITTVSTGIIAEAGLSSFQVFQQDAFPPNPTHVAGFVRYPAALSAAPLSSDNVITIVRDSPIAQTSQYANQSIIYPPVIEQDYDYGIMIDQELSERIDRCIQVNPVDPVPAPLPYWLLRINQAAFFDGQGNLTAGKVPGGTTFISAAMQPVVSAATIQAAQIAFGLGQNGYSAISGKKTSIGSTTTLDNSYKGYTVGCINNAYYSVIIDNALTYDAEFQVLVINFDLNRAKLIVVPGYAPLKLYPGQWVWISHYDGAQWFRTGTGGIRWHPVATQNIFVDANFGSDANDGLAPGVGGAFRTIQKAIDTVENDVDGNFVIVLAVGVHPVGAGITCRKAVLGSSGYLIVGDQANPFNVFIQSTNASITIFATNNAAVTILGVTIGSSTNSGISVAAQVGAVVNIGLVHFFPVNQADMLAHINGTINVTGTISIHSSNLGLHCWATNGGTFLYAPGTVTIVNALTVSAFFLAAVGSSIYTQGQVVNFVNGGLVSGPQYSVQFNSVLHVSGSVIPGNIPGSLSTGGQFG